MPRNLIVLLGLTIPVLLLSGCIYSNDVHIYQKRGIVIKIEYDVIFGGTFTDWRDDVCFADGTILWVQGGDLSKIRINESGLYTFKTNFFEYDGVNYEFYKFIGVEYIN